MGQEATIAKRTAGCIQMNEIFFFFLIRVGMESYKGQGNQFKNFFCKEITQTQPPESEFASGPCP